MNKLTSTKTQLPYDYYSLPFCRPSTITNAVENLGEVLHGSVIQNSPYDIFMGKSDFKVLCMVSMDRKSANVLSKRIREEVSAHWIYPFRPYVTPHSSQISHRNSFSFRSSPNLSTAGSSSWTTCPRPPR